MSFQINLSESWKEQLKTTLNQPSFIALTEFLRQELNNGKTIYPPQQHIFAAFNNTTFNQVKVVIVGQDPYHGDGQANGLSFSVAKGQKIPPSLRNIFKELKQDIPEFEIPQHGDLSEWAKQGVLLLNATLTVEKDRAGSHQKKGWEVFTDEVIKLLSTQKSNLVFILWGKFAQSKAALINDSKHLILKAAHPSPLSVHNGFWECKHFSKTNQYLALHNLPIIKW